MTADTSPPPPPSGPSPSPRAATPAPGPTSAPGPAARDATAELQNRFLAHMSHELRTPLSGLLGLVDLARRSATDPVQRRFLEVAMQSGRTLQRSIDHVLDLTRLRDGRLQLADEPFDLAEAVAEVLRGSMPLVREKGLFIRYDWVGEPTWVRGDELRVRQIVGNLVGNAAKFTLRGHVTVTAELQPAGGDPDRVTLLLRVEDTGPGLDAAPAAQVFEHFVQADASLTRAHGGTGLGLSIARDLAHRMGGRITLDSRPGVGSLFTLELPLRRAPDPDPLPEPAPGLVWLLYPQPELGEWLARRFERLGWTATTLDSIARASAVAQGLPPGERPDLLLMSEPVMTGPVGPEVLRRALPATDIRLLVRPDWSDPPFEQRARALGMTLALAPLPPRELRLMTVGRANDSAPNSPSPRPGPAPAPAASADGDVLVVEDNPTNRMIVEAFLQKLGLRSRSVADGAQALRACAERPPKLVLMDLQMPVMDGLTATRELCARQARGELPSFPIVALTAHAQDADAQACREAGMQGFLTKPLLLDRLRAELARWWPSLVTP